MTEKKQKNYLENLKKLREFKQNCGQISSLIRKFIATKFKRKLIDSKKLLYTKHKKKIEG